MATERESGATEWLSRLRPDLQPLARQVRALIRRSAPGAAEAIDRATASISYVYETRFCTLQAADAGIEIVFDAGALLPDPEGLLIRSDERSRVLEFRSEADLATPAVSALVEAAALRARDPGASYSR
ncbi:MAG: DUF1801 domain-containing protein [Chloroflexi bacterium]|nr:DUF1801 domain-containing protein [Chloroflexota bacterium]